MICINKMVTKINFCTCMYSKTLTLASVSSLRNDMVSNTEPLDVRALRCEFFFSNSFSNRSIVFAARCFTLLAWSSLSYWPIFCPWARPSNSFITVISTRTHHPYCIPASMHFLEFESTSNSYKKTLRYVISFIPNPCKSSLHW